MSIKNDLNIEWLKCHHGVLKSQHCTLCEQEKNRYKLDIGKRVSDKKELRIPILRGCRAAGNGGCFCDGHCRDIIGYRDPFPGEINPSY